MKLWCSFLIQWTWKNSVFVSEGETGISNKRSYCWEFIFVIWQLFVLQRQRIEWHKRTLCCNVLSFGMPILVHCWQRGIFLICDNLSTLGIQVFLKTKNVRLKSIFNNKKLAAKSRFTVNPDLLLHIFPNTKISKKVYIQYQVILKRSLM